MSRINYTHRRLLTTEKTKRDVNTASQFTYIIELIYGATRCFAALFPPSYVPLVGILAVGKPMSARKKKTYLL